jgi:alpha/beta superfamily hydrolase
MRSSWAPAALAGAAMLLTACAKDPMDDPEYAAACHGKPVHGAADRSKAQEEGYSINERFDCIDRQSYEQEQKYRAETETARGERVARDARPKVRSTPAKLADARAGFSTSISSPPSGRALPHPPAKMFVRSDFDSTVGKLPAWVTPDPRDGAKHPAIVWITGGDSNSLDDFWTEGGADDDQSASAFRKAGVVMMFPTLRGGNTNAGRKEFFYGEVDDVIAAARHAASLPYVSKVYLGGHSTGGTLVLLAAETGEFDGVFVFGAVTDVSRYPAEMFPGAADADEREARLRSPVHWLDGISSPTYLIEGVERPGNFMELEELCAATRNPFVHCVPVPGSNHFSVIDAVGKRLAARIAVDVANGDALVTEREFSRGAANGE